MRQGFGRLIGHHGTGVQYFKGVGTGLPITRYQRAFVIQLLIEKGLTLGFIPGFVVAQTHMRNDFMQCFDMPFTVLAYV